MTANLMWVPTGGANSTSQIVQYRVPSVSASWTNFATVGPTVSTSNITGLNDNRIHEFRILNNCTVGGSTSSTVDQKIKFVCPNVTTSLTYDSVGYSFSHVGGDITNYQVDLLTSGGSIVATKTHSSPGATITDSFTGLSASTVYKLKVTMTAGAFSKICDDVSVTTPAAPACNPPTSVTVTIS